MSNKELSQPNPIPEASQPGEPLKDRLQSSLQYRLSHRPESENAEPVNIVDNSEEPSEEMLHPDMVGLVCDAPLGLKH